MRYVFALLIILLVGYFWISAAFSPTQEESSKSNMETEIDDQIEKWLGSDGAEQLELQLKIPAADVTIDKHDRGEALYAKFDYTDRWKEPELIEELVNGRKKIQVKQDSDSWFGSGSGSRNKWQLSVNPELEYHYDIKIGAGNLNLDLAETRTKTLSLSSGAASTNIDLSNSSIANLDLKTGAASITLDLSGTRENDLMADIKGGVGSLKVTVPRDTGVQFRATGLGSISAPGFTRTNGYYRNDSWGNSDHKIKLDIAGGVGSVEVTEK